MAEHAQNDDRMNHERKCVEQELAKRSLAKVIKDIAVKVTVLWLAANAARCRYLVEELRMVTPAAARVARGAIN